MPKSKKKHHNQRGEKPRVRLSGGPLVDQKTEAYFIRTLAAAGKRKVPLSVGVLIDRLVGFAEQSSQGRQYPEFNPFSDVIDNG